MYLFCFCFYPFVRIKKVVSRYRISKKKKTFIFIFMFRRCRRRTHATGKQTGSTFLINVQNFTNLLMETYDGVLKMYASPSRRVISRPAYLFFISSFSFVVLDSKRSSDPPPLPFTLVSSYTWNADTREPTLFSIR